jgi:hypothetical protein
MKALPKGDGESVSARECSTQSQAVGNQKRWNRFPGIRRLKNRIDVCVIATLFPIALFCSAHLGPDSNYDLLNYHAYNGMALIRGRLFSDVAPAGFLTYLNPLFDVPTAGSLLIGSTTLTLSIVVAVLQWVCWIAVWRLVREIARNRFNFATTICCFVLAISGAAAISVAFTTFNDWLVAGAVCEGLRGLLLLAKESLSPNAVIHKRAAFLSGLWFGVSAGVKLTATPYVLAGAVVILVFSKRHRIVEWIIGCATSLLVLVVPWAGYLWVRFGNPFFPFYNNVFQSSSALQINFKDVRFGAKSLRGITSFPVEMARGTSLFSELAYREWRFASLLVLLAVVLARGNSTTFSHEACNCYAVEKTIGLFALIGFLPSIVQFGTYRYLLAIEIVVSLLTVLFLHRLFPKHTASIVSLGMIVLSAFQIAPNWGRNSSIKAVQVPAISANSSILLIDNSNTSYLALKFPASTRVASVGGFEANVLALDGPIGTDLKRFVERGLSARKLFVLTDPLLPTPKSVRILGVEVSADCKPFATPSGVRQLCKAVASSDAVPS